MKEVRERQILYNSFIGGIKKKKIPDTKLIEKEVRLVVATGTGLEGGKNRGSWSKHTKLRL